MRDSINCNICFRLGFEETEEEGCQHYMARQDSHSQASRREKESEATLFLSEQTASGRVVARVWVGSRATLSWIPNPGPYRRLLYS